MTRSASSEIKLTFQSTIRNTLTNNDTAAATISGTVLTGKIDDGIADAQANRAWRTTSREIAANTNLDIDVYDFAGLDIGAGAGLDALGQELVVEEIVALIIKHAGGTGRLEIMPPPAVVGGLAWAPILTVSNGGALKEGGALMMFQNDTDAFDVQDAVSHVLRLRANGAAVTVDVYVLGRDDDEESSSSSSSTSSQSSSSQSSSSTPSSASSASSSQSSLSSSSSPSSSST